MSVTPDAVVVLCGKRKSGKDYVAEKLVEIVGGNVICPLRLSKPIKEQYAKDHNLEVDRLMDSSPYKEKYRHEMIIWSEAVRDSNPEFFCQLAIAEANCSVWLVCDARRESDMRFFKQHFSNCLFTVRVQASEEVRKERGWVYKAEVDAAASECGLDHYECDLTINNDSNEQDLILQLNTLTSWIRKMIH